MCVIEMENKGRQAGKAINWGGEINSCLISTYQCSKYIAQLIGQFVRSNG